MPATLLASALLALGTGAGFAAIARLILQRSEARPRAPIVCFALFWISAAIVWATQGLGSLAAYAGVASVPVNGALDEVSTPFYCLAAASLLYYVLYLLTGRARLLAPILAYYLVLFAALRWRVLVAQRLEVTVEAWQVNFAYATPLEGPVYTLIVVLVAVPLLAAVLSYGTLFFRIRDHASRYRIGLVTVGLTAWIATEAWSFASGVASTTEGELARRLVALASTGVILAAYLPPRSARLRWNVRRAWEPQG